MLLLRRCRAVVLVYDGEPPTPVYGTVADEAPRLQNANIDVSVVSLSYYFSSGAATLNLVQSIASNPFVDHLFTLPNWLTLGNTVAPTILANLQDSCMRKVRFNCLSCEEIVFIVKSLFLILQ